MKELFSPHVASKLAIYRNAMALAGTGNLLICAGEAGRHFLDDNHYPFKVNPFFKEFLPLTAWPGCHLLIGEAAKPTLMLKVADDFWHSAPALPDEEYLAPFEVVEYRDDSELARLLPNGHLAVIAEQAPAFIADASINPLALIHAIDYHRAAKTDYELACLRQANRIAVRGHRAAETSFLAGNSERQIHLDYLRACNQLEEQMPYGNIVGINQNAAVLHHTALNGQAVEPRTMLVDAGAGCNGYAADITRTTVTAAAGELFTALRDGVDAVTLKLVSELKTGNSYVDTHLRAHQLIAELLADTRIVSCSPEQAVERGISSVFFPHGIGHLLGLQVHDRGGRQANVEGDTAPPPAQHPFLRCTRTMEENMVFTIEPGLYFIPMLLNKLKADSNAAVDWHLINQLLPMGGIRVEDNVVVTRSGVENFTRDAFASLE